jgi:hypothetical protein
VDLIVNQGGRQSESFSEESIACSEQFGWSVAMFYPMLQKNNEARVITPMGRGVIKFARTGEIGVLLDKEVRRASLAKPVDKQRPGEGTATTMHFFEVEEVVPEC